MAATLRERRSLHPPLTLLFTVREESGLWGAASSTEACSNHRWNALTSTAGAAEITIGAVGAERWEVEVQGKAAHAGAYPEQGISATMVAAIALGDVYKAGWFGKVSRDGRQGTSNVGVFGGADGQAPVTPPTLSPITR